MSSANESDEVSPGNSIRERLYQSRQAVLRRRIDQEIRLRFAGPGQLRPGCQSSPALACRHAGPANKCGCGHRKYRRAMPAWTTSLLREEMPVPMADVRFSPREQTLDGAGGLSGSAHKQSRRAVGGARRLCRLSFGQLRPAVWRGTLLLRGSPTTKCFDHT